MANDKIENKEKSIPLPGNTENDNNKTKNEPDVRGKIKDTAKETEGEKRFKEGLANNSDTE